MVYQPESWIYETAQVIREGIEEEEGSGQRLQRIAAVDVGGTGGRYAVCGYF